MKSILFGLLIISGATWAQTPATSAAPAGSTDVSSRYTHNVLMAIGVNEGGFSMGADYEYQGSQPFGVGGYTRFYQKDSDGTTTASGFMTFGVFIRPHFYKKNWDLYVSPGFGVVNVDPVGKGDETSFGPSLALGLMYQIQSQLAVGVENMKTYSWFNDDYRGLLINDFMVKARISF